MPIETDPLLTPDGRVAGDLLCGDCGYNLRTLPTEARCPECGAAVQDAVDRERTTSPAWVEVVSGGLSLLVVTLVLGVVAYGFMFVGWGVAIPFCVVTTVAGLSGLFVITRPFPGQPPRSDAYSARGLIRWTLIAIVASACALIFVQAAAMAIENPELARLVLRVVVPAGILVPLLVLPILLARHLRNIMQRLSWRSEASFASMMQTFTVFFEVMFLPSVIAAAKLRTVGLLLVSGVMAFAFLVSWGYLFWQVSNALAATLERCKRARSQSP